MNPWIILLAAISAIAAVYWYFLLGADQPSLAQAASGGVNELRIQVQGGYSPAYAKIPRAQPLRLIIDRQEDSPCSEEIVLPEAGIQRFLPPFAQTVIEFTPESSGTYEFTCGMKMLRGKLEVV